MGDVSSIQQVIGAWSGAQVCDDCRWLLAVSFDLRKEKVWSRLTDSTAHLLSVQGMRDAEQPVRKILDGLDRSLVDWGDVTLCASWVTEPVHFVFVDIHRGI